jgi:ubiquinone/menaquinone biosynthesis C-methylase UbiE
LSEHYDTLYSRGYLEKLRRDNYVRYAVLSRIIKDKNPKGKVVLDFGCGGGLYSSLFAEVGAIIIGVDISKVAVKIANKQRKRRESRASYIVCSGENLPFKEESFDEVFTSEVFEHLLNPLKAFKSISRVLKHNGELLASTPCGNRFSVEWIITYLLGGPVKTKDGFSNFWPDYLEDNHLQRFTSEEIKKFLKEEDITIYNIFWYDHIFRHLCQVVRLIFKVSRIKPQNLNLGKIEYMDVKLFKKFSNGTGMIISGCKE